MHRWSTSLAVLFFLTAAPFARANLIELTLSGPIAASNMNAFPAGQSLSVTLRFESSGAPQSIQSQQAFYADHIEYFRLTSGAYDSTDSSGPFGKINKYDGLAGTDGISFQVASNVGHYQFGIAQTVQLSNVLSDSINQTFENLFLNLARNDNTLWSNYDLPTTFNFADFNQTQNISLSFSGGSFFAGLTTLSYTNLSVAPEPSTLSLAVLGAAALVCACRGFTHGRRRATGRAR